MKIQQRQGDSHTSLILLIVMVSITVGGIAVFIEFQQNAAATPGRMLAETTAEQQKDFEILNVIGNDVSGKDISGVRFQVEYSGTGKIALNESFIQIMVDESIADLQYRDGDLVRDINTGYYTE